MRRLSKNERVRIALTLNGRKLAAEAEPRMLLSDFLRQGLGATGTHVGCEHGICGCLHRADRRRRHALLPDARGAGRRPRRASTVESLAAPDGTLNPLQTAFRNNHALQCGFCTPGILMSFTDYLARNPHPTDRRNPRSLERPPLPLHRLRRHRQGGEGGGEGVGTRPSFPVTLRWPRSGPRRATARRRASFEARCARTSG